MVKDIAKQKDAINDLYKIFSEYLSEIQAIIKPKNKGTIMQVDQMNIGLNITQTKGAVVSYLQEIVHIMCADLTISALIGEDEKARRERNYNRVKAAKNEAKDVVAELEPYLQNLDFIKKNKVDKFFAKDAEYSFRANKLHSKYSSFIEKLVQGSGEFAKDLNDMVHGVL